MQRQRDKNTEQTPPPQALDIERTIIGASMSDAMILDMAIERLREDDFYLGSHRELFVLMRDMEARKEPVDIITISTNLESRKRNDLFAAATECAGSVCTGETAEGYISILADKGVLRRLINYSAETMKMCQQNLLIDEILQKSEQGYFSAVEKKDTVRDVSATEAVRRAMEITERVFRGESVGVPSGFQSLDAQIGGFEPGCLYILAGRPSMGKTAFALCLALEQSVRHGIPVTYFSLEMPASQLGQRVLSIEAKVNLFLLRTAKLKREDWIKVSQVSGTVADAKIVFDDRSGLTLQKFRAAARRMIRQYGTQVIYVDHLHLMSYPEEDPTVGITRLTRGFKATAMDLGVPIVVLSQLSRKNEVRTKKDRRPMLSDLRQSGSIEQDADGVFFVHREYVYTKAEEDRNTAEIIIAKQRNGPCEIIPFVYAAESARFYVDDSGGF